MSRRAGTALLTLVVAWLSTAAAAGAHARPPARESAKVACAAPPPRLHGRRAAAAHARCRWHAPARTAHATAWSARRATTATPAPARTSGLVASASGAYAIRLTWPQLPGAAAVEVLLGGALIDRVPASQNRTYTIRELWPSTSYALTVEGLTATGTTVRSLSVTASTSAAAGAFPRLYGAGAFVNTPIGAAPTPAANSSAIVGASITPYAASANLSDSTAWGIPIVSADAQSQAYTVGCQEYWCTTSFGALEIPAGAQPNTGSDGHLVVLEPSGSELDMWLGQHAGGTWTSGERWVESASGPAANCATPWGCGAADAAGFALGAGVIRPEEIAQGHIDHALLIATPNTRAGYVACPAVSGDGHNGAPTALPLGAHVQLDPSVDVAALPIPAWQKVIAVALQRYGAYVGDTGGSLEVRAESNLGRGYDAWAKAGVSSNSPSLADLPWSRMRVLSMTQCA